MTMNKKDLIDAIKAAEAILQKRKYNKAATYFRDDGVNSREKYPKHMELMRAEKNHRLLAFVGGNGTGKSLWNALSTYYHMSGKYPEWWEGYKYKRPITVWMCAREAKNLREGIQEILFGDMSDIGTGIIAREDLLDDKGVVQTWALSGTANCVGQCLVRHCTDGVFDGYSKVEFKTYAQGWKEFQGPTRDLITFDEEPDDVKIYAECTARLRPKDGGDPGRFLATFTPTLGFSETYLAFVPNGIFPEGGEHEDNPQKYTVQVTWDDVPHLPEEWKQSQILEWKISDPNNLEARTLGIAAMGSGLVYPVDFNFITTPKEKIPPYWPRCYGMDPGQANFAVVWVTKDPNTGIYYVYDEYKHGKVVYLIHAEAIKNRGQWIPGGIDPHEAVKPRDTGETVQGYFQSLGLDLAAAKGNPDAVRARIRAMLESGALKIMGNCERILKELRTYRYDPNDPNKIAKNQDDHLLDALLYALTVFDNISTSYSEYEEEELGTSRKNKTHPSGRNKITGY